jgi:hypothetical protein
VCAAWARDWKSGVALFETVKNPNSLSAIPAMR